MSRQHHEPAPRDAAAAAREPDRVAARPQAAAQRAPHVDPLAVPALLVAAGPPARRGQLEARHQAVELRELVRLERVEAPVPEQLLVAREGQRHLDLREIVVVVRGARAMRTTRSRADPPRPGRGATSCAPTSAARRAERPRSARPRARSLRDRPDARRPRGTPRRRPSPVPDRTRTRRGRSSTGAAA